MTRTTDPYFCHWQNWYMSQDATGSELIIKKKLEKFRYKKLEMNIRNDLDDVRKMHVLHKNNLFLDNLPLC